MTATATEHPNAQRMRDVAAAVARGDVEAALEHFPDDVVWYAPAERAQERVYHGREGVMSFFAGLQERSSGTMTPEVDDVLGSESHVVIFLRVTAQRGDQRLDARVAHFATVGANGFTRNWFLPNNLTAWNRFFG